MKQLRILFALLTGISGGLCAQNPAVVDSLERLAARAPNDSLRAEVYDKLGDYISPFNNEQLGVYARKILALAERARPDGTVETLMPLAQARGHYQLGNYYYRKGEYAEALRSFYVSLPLYEQLNNRRGVGAILSCIARVYVVQDQWAEAEDYYLRSKAAYEAIHFEKGVRSVLINYGAMLGRQDRSEEALKYYLEAEKTFSDPKDYFGLATIYSNIGFCYRRSGQPGLARQYYEKAARVYADTGEYENLELLQMNLGDLLLDEGLYPEALGYYQKALASARFSGRKNHIKTVYNSLAQVHIRLGEAATDLTEKDSLYGKAFEFNDIARIYADSLLDAERSRQLSELEVRYETERKEHEISRLGAEAQIRKIALLKQEVELRQRRLEADRAREQAVLLEKTNTNIALELAVNAANLRGQNAENQRKQQEIELLNQQNALQETETRRVRAVSAGLAVGLTLFALLLFVMLRLFWLKNRATRAMRRQNREILRQQQEIEAQNYRLEEASRFKSIFLSNMSHEIRTPLNTVINVAELLADTPLNPRQRGYTEAVQSASQNLLFLLNDILDLSKIEAGKIEIRPEPFDLPAFLEQQTELLRFNLSGRDVSLTLQCAEDLPPAITADAGRLGQVLLNLLGNALKFTEQGGITLSCSVAERPTADRVVLEFAVEDTGIGIAPDKLEHIFEAFTQAETDTHVRYGGTGLGLAITKQLVELQGGTLWAESAPGQGSAFRFTLPAPVTELQQSVALPVASSEKLPSCRLLLVEDNLLNQMLALDLLEKIIERPDIVTAQNGAEAVEKAGAGDFDLVLMDIRMPVLDGFAAAAALRKNGLKTPIIALTANATTEEEQKCRAAGMNDYLSKPINLALMRGKIARIIR